MNELNDDECFHCGEQLECGYCPDCDRGNDEEE